MFWIMGALLLPIIVGSVRSVGWAPSIIIVGLVLITGAMALMGDTILTVAPWTIALLLSFAATKRPL